MQAPNAHVSTSVITAPQLERAAHADAPRNTSRLDAVRLIEADPASRQQLERFIAARFTDVYGAHVRQFMPRLLGLHEIGGGLIAALGLRSALYAPLFLEQYLEAPVEQVVSAHFGVDARRGDIVEIGNLAGASPGALRRLIPALTAYLHGEGVRWIAFTGSARLCGGFSRLGLPLEVVAPAQIERLPLAEREDWGSYYEHDPSVMLGDVVCGYRRLNPEQMCDQLGARLAPLSSVGTP